MNKPEDQKKSRRTAGEGVGKGDTSGLLREALWELQETHEGLRVAGEEMRAQNEALAEAAEALEAERRRYRDLFHAAPEPALLTDLSGVVQEANPAAHALLGVGPRSLTGKPLAVFVGLDSRRVFRTALLGQTQIRERGIYLQPKRGAMLYAVVRVSPVSEAGGRPVGLRWQVRGATADPGAELERWRHIMAEVRDFAIFTMDAESRITGWNAGAEAIFGWTAAEVLGRPGEIIFTAEDRAEGVPEQERGQAAATGRAEDERWHVRKDGSRLWASGVMTALRDDEGGPPWYAKIVRDLTERRLHEQREHAVATQLQAAVQPAAPSGVPGLAVRTLYRPAHSELSVGGDFFDVFGLGDGRTALVVGDVSGKGLEAAAQVATVRNMLRFALYNAPSGEDGALTGAVTTLNRTLAAHGLLAGFVTLFVGVFDPDACALAYVNCGQEAALLRRAAAGDIEFLRFTGPLLGMDAGAEFTEAQAALTAGDVLTVFTDGLTDIGPNRLAMLGEEGVAALLRGPIPGLDDASGPRAAEVVTARLTAALDAHGPENIPDDVCVLVAVVESALESPPSAASRLSLPADGKGSLAQ